ncbi:MAG TPA: winged helix DNA-binding protein [Fimbriimonadaceae bacterium]|nr:winged helix DNA-binding protein [Fimbriimonadaceae bacterium]
MKYQDLERNPGYQLWLATNAWQRIVRKALEPLHLTYVQFVLMASVDVLSLEGDCVTQAQVARFAATDENMTSQVIRSLAERGLLVRVEHPTDARARCLSLTDSGKSLLYEGKALVKPVRERFFEPLGERAVDLAQLLREVVDALDEEE